MTSQQSPNQKVQNDKYSKQEQGKTDMRGAQPSHKTDTNATKDSNYAADAAQSNRPGQDRSTQSRSVGPEREARETQSRDVSSTSEDQLENIDESGKRR